jgi:hypothetical protein
VTRKGIVGAVLETVAVSLQDTFRFMLGTTLRLFVFLPFVLCLRVFRLMNGLIKKTEEEKAS